MTLLIFLTQLFRPSALVCYHYYHCYYYHHHHHYYHYYYFLHSNTIALFFIMLRFCICFSVQLFLIYQLISFFCFYRSILFFFPNNLPSRAFLSFIHLSSYFFQFSFDYLSFIFFIYSFLSVYLIISCLSASPVLFPALIHSHERGGKRGG